MRSIKLLMAILLSVMLVAPLFVSACEPESTEVFELSLSSAYPELEPPTVAWIEKIEAETNGRVQITGYFGLHDMMNALAELEAGVADIAMVPVGVIPGVPISKANDSFGYGFPEGKELEIGWDLWDEFSEWRDEFKNVKVLCWAGGVTSFYIMTNEPVRTVDDIEGMILRGISFHIEPFKRMGAEVVTMSATETYTAVEKGTVDGCILPPSFFSSYSMYEVVDYATCLHVSPMSFPAYCMNMDVWNSLPSDIQDIIDDSLEAWSEDWVQWTADEDIVGLDLAEAEGVEFIEFSEAELAKVYGYYAEVALEVAADLDAQGLPGTEIYEEMRRLIEEYS